MRGLGFLALCVTLWGCGEPPAGDQQPAVTAAAAQQQPFADAEITDAVMDKWTRSCSLCHVNGAGGAPRIGNAEDWRPRLAQGEATLLTHSIEGFNRMPPLGYCMSCERDDLRALIKLMSGGA